jgi:hypothetical protein
MQTSVANLTDSHNMIIVNLPEFRVGKNPYLRYLRHTTLTHIRTIVQLSTIVSPTVFNLPSHVLIYVSMNASVSATSPNEQWEPPLLHLQRAADYVVSSLTFNPARPHYVPRSYKLSTR